MINEKTIVTNAHVVTYTKKGNTCEYDTFEIRTSAEEEYHTVNLVKCDHMLDIAVLTIIDDDYSLIPVETDNSDDISFGETVFAIGNASNYGISISQGIISIPHLNIEYNNYMRDVIQSDITISPGNSGGALINENGKFIGLTSFRTKDELGNVNYGWAYSIPSNIILDYITSTS